MDFKRHFEAGSVLPPFYNHTLVEHHEQTVTALLEKNMLTAFEKIGDLYSKLPPHARDGEEGFAMLNVLTSGLRMLLATTGKFKAPGRSYFQARRSMLLALPNKTKALGDLLKAEFTLVTIKGDIVDVPMRVQQLVCAVCMSPCISRCAGCRSYYFCGRPCLIKSTHRKGKTCTPFDPQVLPEPQTETSGFAF